MSDKLNKETVLPTIAILKKHKDAINDIKLDYGYSTMAAFVRGLIVAAIQAHKSGTLSELLNKPKK